VYTLTYTLLAMMIAFSGGLLVGTYNFNKPRFLQSPIIGLIGTAVALLIYLHVNEIKTPMQFFLTIFNLPGALGLGLFIPKLYRRLQPSGGRNGAGL
jgi:hypothetical protein